MIKMIEIFDDISKEVKDGAELIFNAAVNAAKKNNDIINMVNTLNNYINNCPNEREREFVHFYFNLRMEQIINENNNVKR